MAQNSVRPVALFGGAITTQLPGYFRDASDFREIPDTQEVYVSMVDGNDLSVVVDLLQRVPAADDAAALKTHWEDVAEEPDRSVRVLAQEPVTLAHLADKPAYQIVGAASARFTDRPTDPPLFTAILMTVVRLEQQTTDITITVNVPFTSPNMVLAEGTMASPTYEGTLTGVRGPLLDAGIQLRDLVVQNFSINDWGLFLEDPVPEAEVS